MNDDTLITLAGSRDETAPATALTHRRLAGESGQAFAAFEQWLTLGPERSLPRVAQACAKHVSLLKRWSARWWWAARLISFEDEQAAIRREAESKAALEHAKVREARRAEVEELQYLAGRELVAKAREIVASVGGLPARPADAARLAAVGVQLLRLATGLPPNAIEVTGKEDASLIPTRAGLDPEPVVHITIVDGHKMSLPNGPVVNESTVAPGFVFVRS